MHKIGPINMLSWMGVEGGDGGDKTPPLLRSLCS